MTGSSFLTHFSSPLVLLARGGGGGGAGEGNGYPAALVCFAYLLSSFYYLSGKTIDLS